MTHLLSNRGLAKTHGPADGQTTPVPRLRGDILALLHLANFDLPPLRVVRPAHVVHVYYSFGDASGRQFGATVSKDYSCRHKLGNEARSERGVRFCIGLWMASEEVESSNYKELITWWRLSWQRPRWAECETASSSCSQITQLPRATSIGVPQSLLSSMNLSSGSGPWKWLTG